MNRKKMGVMIADPTALAELQKCTSVSELVDWLNKAGAECTREEGLRFLRAWESVAEDDEDLDMEDANGGPDSGSGLFGFLRSIFVRNAAQKRRSGPCTVPEPLTIEKILDRMNR